MKIVVALDKFKGSLTAPDACEIVRRELLRIYPGAHIVIKPMADGGDGTADALHAALGGEWITKQVTGPLPNIPRTARYLWLAKDRQAFIEMAQASGLLLVPPAQHNPLLTTTYGTGELLADAIQRGAQRLWLTVGGSATTDGGIGAATALGWQFLDAAGKPVQPIGGELQKITTLHASRFTFPAIEVLCDVDNPLCGEHGAARVFGPQKGATPAMVEQLDAGLRHLATLVKTQLGKDILNVPGAGAAGGLAAGAIAFLNARLVPGIETVMRASRLAEELADADWVITGEGRFDAQSLRGKVVSGVTSLAQRTGTKVAVIAGSVELTEAEWKNAGVATALAIKPATMSTAEAMRRAEELLATAARELFQTESQATQ
ncbi:MAG: glycerate kinase [Verrucomicrobia bacterium]|nr:glycerate kinase [Verrucomicrobiota bacterium]